MSNELWLGELVFVSSLSVFKGEKKWRGGIMYYPVSHEKEMYAKYIRKLRPCGDGATVVLKIR